MLPLSTANADAVEGVPAFRHLTAAEAAAAEIPAAPSSVWLLLPDGACRATVGKHYAAIEPFFPSRRYGVELHGCAVPAADAQAVAVVSVGQPACRAIRPKPVASRDSTTIERVDPATGESSLHWASPDDSKSTPIPGDLAALLPARECRAPQCEALWTVSAVDSSSRQVVWIGGIELLRVGADTTYDAACGWESETTANVFVRGADGLPVAIFDTHDEGAMVLDAMQLEAVLVDNAGAKVLFFTYPDRYATYDITASGAIPSREVTWAKPHPEAFGFSMFRLGPHCGL